MAEKTYQNTLHDWDDADKPREKLLRIGVRNLTNTELLAILLRTGMHGRNVVTVARELLQSFDNDLDALGRCSVSDLRHHGGVGDAKAVTLLAALELGRRRRDTAVKERLRIVNSRDIYNYFAPQLMDLPHEELWVMLLNRQMRVISTAMLTSGTIAQTTFDVRMVLKTAIEHMASNLVLCHNHPSGIPQPSREDVNITHRTFAAATLMDINFCDHIIVGDRCYFSFADNGALETASPDIGKHQKISTDPK